VDERLTLLAAVGAGLLSFISPCVLPFIPAYLSHVSGPSLSQPHCPRKPQLRLADLAGRLDLLGRVAGLVIMAFGLHALGAHRIVARYRHAPQVAHRPTGFSGATLAGVAFAIGWTPCIGPILAGVIALGGVLETAAERVRLLSAYSLGLAVPSLAAAMTIRPLLAAFATLRRHYRSIELACGAMLVAIGGLLITDQFVVVAGWLSP
jgi:cytochrome c-type biogenesis protein